MVTIKQFFVLLISVLIITLTVGCQLQLQHDDLRQQSLLNTDTKISNQVVPFLDLTNENIVECERIDLDQLQEEELFFVHEYKYATLPETKTLLTDQYLFFTDIGFKVSCIDYKSRTFLWSLQFPALDREDLKSYQCKWMSVEGTTFILIDAINKRQRIHGIDAFSGQEIWHDDLPDKYLFVDTHNQSLITVLSDKTLLVRDVHSGKVMKSSPYSINFSSFCWTIINQNLPNEILFSGFDIGVIDRVKDWSTIVDFQMKDEKINKITFLDEKSISSVNRGMFRVETSHNNYLCLVNLEEKKLVWKIQEQENNRFCRLNQNSFCCSWNRNPDEYVMYENRFVILDETKLKVLHATAYENGSISSGRQEFFIPHTDTTKSLYSHVVYTYITENREDTGYILMDIQTGAISNSFSLTKLSRSIFDNEDIYLFACDAENYFLYNMDRKSIVHMKLQVDDVAF